MSLAPTVPLGSFFLIERFAVRRSNDGWRKKESNSQEKSAAHFLFRFFFSDVVWRPWKKTRVRFFFFRDRKSTQFKYRDERTLLNLTSTGDPLWPEKSTLGVRVLHHFVDISHHFVSVFITRLDWFSGFHSSTEKFFNSFLRDFSFF